MSVEAVKWALCKAPLPKSDPTARLVLAYLCEKADKHGRRSHPQRTTIAHDLDLDPETVKRVLDRLVAFGLISKEGVWAQGQPNWKMEMSVVRDEGSYQAFMEKHRSGEAAKKARYRKGQTGVVHDDESGTLQSVHDDASECPRRSIDLSTTMRRNVHDAESPHNHPLEPSKEPSRRKTDEAAENPEARKLCEHLADLMVDNGSKRPTITAKWLNDARLLLSRDNRPLSEAISVLEWSQADTFWKHNIHSIPTFRTQYDKLRGKASDSGALVPRAPKIDDREQARSWLLTQWESGSVAEVAKLTGIRWTAPDLPLGVSGGKAAEEFWRADRKRWIQENHELIISTLMRKQEAAA